MTAESLARTKETLFLQKHRFQVHSPQNPSFHTRDKSCGRSGQIVKLERLEKYQMVSTAEDEPC